MINVYMLCAVYRLINWCDFDGVSGIYLFLKITNNLVASSANNIVLIIFLPDICCWFGDVAVKYANITNMPPT